MQKCQSGSWSSGPQITALVKTMHYLFNDPASFRDGQFAIDFGDNDAFRSSVRPFDLKLVDGRGGAKPKVQGHIILRRITPSAHHIPTLSYLAGSEINSGADRIFWTLPRNI